MFDPTADIVFADGPVGSPNNPQKVEIRKLLRQYESFLAGIGTNGGFLFTSKASIDLNLGYPGLTMAWVIGDPDPANDGVYQKVGATGAGPWVRRAPLPYSVLYAQNANSGTANAVVATSSLAVVPTAYSQLISVPFTAANTGAMTLSINGEMPRALVTNTGEPIPAGYVTAGMSALVQIDSAGNYRLFSYGDATAIQAAAEAAMTAAEAACDLAVEAAGANVTAETAAALSTAAVPPTLQYIRTSSHNLMSKLGAALYKKVDTEPTHNLWEPRAGGGFWDISVARVDATMAGMVGDNSYDNGTALVDLLGYAGMFGAEAFVPRGRYRASAVSRYLGTDTSVPPPSLRGEGSRSTIIEASADAYYVLEFGNCQGLHIEGIGIRKSPETHTGGGLYLHECHYGYVKDVLCWGFEVGFEAVNVLSTLFERPMALYNDIGFRAAKNDAASIGVKSHPNALTILAPIWGLNAKHGGEITGPSSLKIVGGSIEGNGVDAASVGGLHIINPGYEGGVGLDIDGVHMERNAGMADIYIVAIANADITHNVHGCSIFPIDNSSFTANRIYVENSVHQILNVWGNSFRHYGSYSPSAARKYIAAANPSLLSVNLMGDEKQFFSATEYPMGLGAMGLAQALRVNADGTLLKAKPGWTINKTASGEYQIALPAHLSTANYSWTATANGDPLRRVTQLFVGPSSLTVDIVDGSGIGADGAFSLTATPL